MLVLILIYMYQFKTVSGLFIQVMGMSEEGWEHSADAEDHFILSFSKTNP